MFSASPQTTKGFAQPQVPPIAERNPFSLRSNVTVSFAVPSEQEARRLPRASRRAHRLGRRVREVDARGVVTGVRVPPRSGMKYVAKK